MVTFYVDIHKILESRRCMALLRGGLRLYTLWMEQLGEAVILIFDHKMEIKDWFKKTPGASNSSSLLRLPQLPKYQETGYVQCWWLFETFVFLDLYSELEIIDVFMPVAAVNPL